VLVLLSQTLLQLIFQSLCSLTLYYKRLSPLAILYTFITARYTINVYHRSLYYKRLSPLAILYTFISVRYTINVYHRLLCINQVTADNLICILDCTCSYRYIEDVLSLNNSKCGDFVNGIYLIELEIKDTIDTVRSASYLDLHLYTVMAC
jgi:hypothetical protein